MTETCSDTECAETGHMRWKMKARSSLQGTGVQGVSGGVMTKDKIFFLGYHLQISIHRKIIVISSSAVWRQKVGPSAAPRPPLYSQSHACVAASLRWSHLQQGERGQKAGVKLFHIEENFQQVNVHPGQPVANKVVLSVALQGLPN